jgi:hypothetical protein
VEVEVAEDEDEEAMEDVSILDVLRLSMALVSSSDEVVV